MSIGVVKLRAAKKLAITKKAKAKVKSNAQEILDGVESRIKTIALNRFAIRKVKRLKALGKEREEINQVLLEMSAAEDILKEKAKGKLPFGIDKKYVSKDIDAILKESGFSPAKSANEADTSMPENVEETTQTEKVTDNTKETTQTVEAKDNTKETTQTSEVKDKTPRKITHTNKDGSTEIISIENFETFVKNKTENTNINSTNTENINNNSVQSAEPSKVLNELPVNVINQNTENTDSSVHNTQNTDNTQNTVNNTDKSVHNTDKSVHNTQNTVNNTDKTAHNTDQSVNNTQNTNQQTTYKTEGESRPTPELNVVANPDTDTQSTIAANNEKVFDHLVSIGELKAADYVLELMTKPESKGPSKTSEIQEYTTEITKLSDINNGIKDVLEEMHEASIDEQDTSVDLLTKKENSANTAIPDIGGKDKGKEDDGGFLSGILGFIGSMASSWFFKFITGFKNIGSFAGHIIKKGWSVIKKLVGGAIKLALKPILAAINLIKKIPILSKFFNKKPIKADSKKPKKTSKIAETKDKAQKANKKPLDPDKKVNKKPLETDKDLKKKKTKKIPKLSNSRMGKTGTGIIKKLAKFTKFIPILGTVIAAGTAVYSAVDGYNRADEILGKAESQLTTQDKLASAAGAMVDDFTFGFVGAATVAKTLTSNDKDGLIQKYEKLGIIDHDIIGNSEIVDWSKVSQIPAKSVQELIDIDDWSDADKEKLVTQRDTTAQVQKTVENYQKNAERINKNNAPEVSKDKQLHNTENNYTAVVNNTKNYDSKAQTSQPAVNINNISGSQTAPVERDINAFELFE